MEAIALGKRVVTHLWLESCKQAGYAIEEKSYILRDEKKEKEIGFSMPITLTRSSRRSLLKVGMFSRHAEAVQILWINILYIFLLMISLHIL